MYDKNYYLILTGKSTTASMLAYVLDAMGDSLTAVVGAHMPQFSGGNIILGDGQNFVLEADEYDGCFLGLSPYIAVVTNLDREHVDIFQNEEAVKATFHKFLNLIRVGRHLILCGDRYTALLYFNFWCSRLRHSSSGAYSLLTDVKQAIGSDTLSGLMHSPLEKCCIGYIITTYGTTSSNEWSASSIRPNLKVPRRRGPPPSYLWQAAQEGKFQVSNREAKSRETAYTAPACNKFREAKPLSKLCLENSDEMESPSVSCHWGRSVADISLQVPGVHNVLNSLAVIATVIALYNNQREINNTINGLRLHLNNFIGVSRRFEMIGTICGCDIYDDYAHHPMEVQAVIQAACQKFPIKSLLVVFQNHTYSRLAALKDDFAIALCGADQVVVTEVYAAREIDVGNVGGRELAASVIARHVNTSLLWVMW
ncbi:putative UDP-N-acetylmuramate--L-alanine ligase [Rosa chinensis]|uniref:Putative UDP-N-acetylmuramate--L-alanine ligase n=2 Tax=Rosa chinensis TaxID=74649 RepID=A0A2P6SND0_ROSCH|nr:putative UDP-N-acetylmuramate--L-alanine ligase [Rosa chinensis]